MRIDKRETIKEATALLGNPINPFVPGALLGTRDAAVEKSKIPALTEPTAS